MILCKNGITKGEYNLLKHEIKRILDDPSPSIKCVMNEIIKPDVEELGEILKEVKKESDDDEKVLELEKLLGAGDYIDDEPVFPMILNAINALEDLPIPKIKLKALQMKMLVKDIEKNKYRIITIFSRLQNARDKEDEQYILKRLGREELLSPEQVSQLSKLEEINSQSIADVIKETKVGQGLLHLPTKIIDLRDKLMKAMREYTKTNHSSTLKQLVAFLEELFRRHGISQKEYEDIKKGLNIF